MIFRVCAAVGLAVERDASIVVDADRVNAPFQAASLVEAFAGFALRPALPAGEARQILSAFGGEAPLARRSVEGMGGLAVRGSSLRLRLRFAPRLPAVDASRHWYVFVRAIRFWRETL